VKKKKEKKQKKEKERNICSELIVRAFIIKKFLLFKRGNHFFFLTLDVSDFPLLPDGSI